MTLTNKKRSFVRVPISNKSKFPAYFQPLLRNVDPNYFWKQSSVSVPSIPDLSRNFAGREMMASPSSKLRDWNRLMSR